ncbi:MAG: 50S ribosomal protein L11 [Candidatus Aenigmarchaeota archaeon]|nr:50S ribosomal protein L11 [Candidatus Aenigmarchaeota archaeon]
MSDKVEVMVKGGQATPAPPIGPALSQAGLNVGQVVAAINEKTKSFAGMEVPVKIFYDKQKKTYEIEVGKPPVTALIKKEIKIEKLATVGEDKIRSHAGDISFDALVKIAEMSNATGDLKAKTKQIVGTCQSGNVTIDGKQPKEVMAEISEGKHDSLFTQ